MLDKQSEDFTKSVSELNVSIKQYEKVTDLQTEHKHAIESLKSQHAQDVEDLNKDKIDSQVKQANNIEELKAAYMLQIDSLRKKRLM